jgi:ABC-2 type transport system permease protein
MIPFILIGDIIMFVNFEFTILEMIMIILSSFILPIFAETLGIIINLKYPKLDAENDTEIVKQSMSSGVAVFAGMILLAATCFGIYKLISMNMNIELVVLIGTLVYFVLDVLLLVYLRKNGVKKFNKINV